jgi:alpha-mannosidase
MESLFWGRTDYQDFNARHERSGLEWIWQGSESMGDSAQIFAGALYGTGGGGYSTWINFDSTDDQVQDNPERHDYNVDQWVDFVVQSALEQANHTQTNHQLWACGTLFVFSLWYSRTHTRTYCLVHFISYICIHSPMYA